MPENKAAPAKGGVLKKGRQASKPGRAKVRFSVKHKLNNEEEEERKGKKEGKQEEKEEGEEEGKEEGEDGKGKNAEHPPKRLRKDEHVPLLFDRVDAYRILKSKVLYDGFANSQIESFTDFVNVQIPKCLSEHPPVVVIHNDSKYVVEILGVRYDYPSVREANGEHRYVYPHECHLRRLNYMFNMLITARYTIHDVKTNKVKHSVIFRDLVFDRIPCMKGSNFCMTTVEPSGAAEDDAECGGYFLSAGSEKVVLGQEAPRNNYPFVFLEKGGIARCEFRSFNETRFRSTSTFYMNATPPFETDNMDERRTAAPKLTVRIPFVTDPLTLPVAFKLLGIDDPEKMLDYILTDEDPEWFQDRVVESLMHNVDALIMSHEHAVTRLAHDRGKSYSHRKKNENYPEETEYERCQRQVNSLISTEFLPHQGYDPDAIPSKRVILGMCARKILRVMYGLQHADDRDHYKHRRVHFTSSLMTLLFRRHLSLWRKRLASQIKRELENGATYVRVKYLLHSNIGGYLSTALSTGNFSMQRGENNLDGVAQQLSRTEPHAHVAHVNRCANPMNRDGRAVKPRLQHPSGIGVIGPWDTPEGQSCGLVRNKAAMAGVRVGYPTRMLADAVLRTGMVRKEGRDEPIQSGECPVFVSGELIGVSRVPPQTLLDLLRAKRAVQDLPFDVSIYQAQGEWAIMPGGEIHINGDPGSLWWPLIRADRMRELRDMLDHITNEDELWSSLLSEGIVECINKDEEENSVRVALDYDMYQEHPLGTFTHIIIHPSQICSIFEAKGTALEFNQSPRITYQAAMSRQSVGRPLSNAAFRADTASYAQWYPQTGLMSTLMDELLCPDGTLSLQNPVVAILCYGGKNIEDSIILNRASVERGRFRSSVTRSIRTVVKRIDGETEHLGLPPEGCRSKLSANYSKINPETGVVEPHTSLEYNDVIVSKHVRMSRKVKRMNDKGELEESVEEHVRDRSVVCKSQEPCIVDEVIWSTTLEGEVSVRIRTRSMRIPEVGNKFACLDGTHDVLTFEHGFLPIAEITTDMRVACLNPKTQTLNYRRPTHVHHYTGANVDNLGPKRMIEFNNKKDFNQRVTENHRIPVYSDDGKSIHMVCAGSLAFEVGKFHPVKSALYGYEGDLDHPERQRIEAFLAKVRPGTRHLWLSLAANMMSRLWSVSKGVVTKRGNDLVTLDILRRIGIKFEEDKDKKRFLLHEEDLGPFKVNDVYARWPLTLPCDDAAFVVRAMSMCFTYKHFDQLMVHAGMTSHNGFYGVHSGAAAHMNAHFISTTVKTGEAVFCLSVPPDEIFCVRRHNIISFTGNSRYGQKGTAGGLYNQEDMPFNPKTGMVPDAIINSHCLEENTPVIQPCGMARCISDIVKDDKVFGYSNNGVGPQECVAVADQGKRETVKITLEDGRVLQATPDHRILVKREQGNEWVNAGDLKMDDQVVASVEGAVDVIGDDEMGWSVQFKSFRFDMDEGRDKTLAFFRMLGYIYSDGCISQSKTNGWVSHASLGCMIDAEAFVDDVELIVGKRPKIRDSSGVFVVTLPTELARAMASVPGMPTGNKVMQPCGWPQCLATAPEAVLREFIAGLMGGDGIMPCLTMTKETEKTVETRNFTTLKLAQSSLAIHEKEIVERMEDLRKFLDRLGIHDVRIIKHKRTDVTSDGLPRIQCGVSFPHSTDFAEKIGLRYCTDKLHRLSAYTSYRRYLDTLNKQTNDFITKVVDHKARTNCTIAEAREAILNAEEHIMFSEHYSTPSTQTINNRIRRKRSVSVMRVDYRYALRADEFFKNTGQLWWFDKGYIADRFSKEFPSYILRVKAVQNAGIARVFDITVPATQCFVAQGLVVHNCLISRMTIGHPLEMAAGKAAALSGQQYDGTPFSLPEQYGDKNDTDGVIKAIGRELESYGFDPTGEEWLCNGMTGEMMNMKVFIGPIGYMPLKHFVMDKFHARARGPRDPQTRQPKDGRHNNGGTRLGEMERDALLAHGMTGTLCERFIVSSDRTVEPICTQCHQIAQPAKRRAGKSLYAATVHADRPFCRVCQRHDTIEMVEMPYTYKLSTQELNGLHLNSAFLLNETSHDELDAIDIS